MHETLKIDDVNFLVKAMIERAPAWTMLRELVMNAIENAALANAEKLVEITSEEVRGVNKMVIRNTGPGMDRHHLKAATNLSASINKELDLDKNFGVGAKISSLKNNRLGMRYRSCCKGAVHEIILAQDPDTGFYVRLEREAEEGDTDTVIDITDAMIASGRDVSFDWTEVMLMGNTVEQDTTEIPYDTGQKFDKNHIATMLYRRFYRVPSGVKIKLDSCYHRFDTTRTFQPIAHRHDKFGRVETVVDSQLGIKVHFLYDPDVGDKSSLRGSSRGALGSTTTTLALVHKNEMYSVSTGRTWWAKAPDFGISFGAKVLCVHIELDDDEARASQYRERLISKSDGEDIVPEDFAGIVKELMPDWVREVIQSQTPQQSDDLSDIQAELQKMLDALRLRSPGRAKSIKGDPSELADIGDVLAKGLNKGNRRPSTGASKPTLQNIHEVPKGARSTSQLDIFERAPKFTFLYTPEDVDEKQLADRAAEYSERTGEIFVNALYSTISEMGEILEPEFRDAADPEVVSKLIKEGSLRAMCLGVGTAVVHALAKKKSSAWTEDHRKTALSRESLTIHADEYFSRLPFVRKYVRQQLKVHEVQTGALAYD